MNEIPWIEWGWVSTFELPQSVVQESPELTALLEDREEIHEQTRYEAQTIYHLLNLTTLWRLNEWRDLDMLFDWEADLWWEETLALHSIIEVFNGKHSFSSLKPPKTVSMVVRWLRKNYSYKYEYDEIETDDWTIQRVKSIHADATWPFNASTITFNYSQEDNSELESIHFNRPWLRVSQEIFVTRNEQWDIDSLRVWRAFSVDNKLQVVYDELWRIWEVTQRKLWVWEAIGIWVDTTRFWYRGTEMEPSGIMYNPAFSLKRTRRAMNRSEDAGIIFFWISWSIENLKKTKWIDIFEIENNALGVPENIVTKLWASRWYYTWEARSYDWDEDGSIISSEGLQDRIWRDKKISVNIGY